MGATAFSWANGFMGNGFMLTESKESFFMINSRFWVLNDLFCLYSKRTAAIKKKLIASKGNMKSLSFM